MDFRAVLELDGRTAPGITVPAAVLDGLGSGKRPAVRVTINGHSYASTIGTMGGVPKIPVSAAHRKAAGITAGDTVDVTVEPDTSPRSVTIPSDLAAALDRDRGARAFFDTLTASQQKGFVTPIEQAKTADTRDRRIEKAVTALQEGRKRP